MSGEKGFACPRCGRKASYLETQVKGSQVYYIAVHYEGYQKVKDKVKKKVRKCYLGPKEYILVEKFHGLGLAGLVDPGRFRRYVREAIDSAGFSLGELLELIGDLADRALERAEAVGAEEARAALSMAWLAREKLSKVCGKLCEKSELPEPAPQNLLEKCAQPLQLPKNEDKGQRICLRAEESEG